MKRGNPPNFRRNRRKGQAVVEYMAMILVALAIAGALGFGFRSLFLKVWMVMACEITAPCPGCAAPPELKAIANKISKGACK